MRPTSFYVATPIIDAEDLLVEKTEAQLGEKRPTDGSQYRLIAAELDKVVADLFKTSCTTAAWGGPAAVAFCAEMQIYCGLVHRLVEIHGAAANVVDTQAATILRTRKSLEGTTTRLAVAKVAAQGAALSGDLPGALLPFPWGR